MKTVWIATAQHIDDRGLNVNAVGKTKEAASRGLIEAIDADLTAEQKLDNDQVEMNREMYLMLDPVEMPVAE